MKIYEVKPGTKVKILDNNVRVPPDAINVNKGDEIVVGRLDGMYCKSVNINGDNVYIAGWTNVEII